MKEFQVIRAANRGRWRALPIAALAALVFFGESSTRAEPGAKTPDLSAAQVSDADIEQWIKELGHDAFTVRQNAAAQLQAHGGKARRRLVEIAEGPDPETRASARRLIALIDQSEFHRRLEAFAADSDGQQGLTLPGWETFRELVGDDAPARELFVEMQREEGSLLAAAFGVTDRSADQLWEERLIRLVGWQAITGDREGTPPLGSCATVLFLGASSKVAVSDRGAMLLENLIQRPPLRERLAAAQPDDVIRRLAVRWILDCPNANEVILGRRLNLIAVTNLQEALPLAVKVATGDPEYLRVPPTTRATAILIIGQLGDSTYLEKLEPLLQDSSVCMPVQAQLPGQVEMNVQIRDVALVALLQITGQRPAEYGYIHARLQPQRMYQLQTLRRENDRQREEAIAKWHAWRAEQKEKADP